MPIIYVKVNLFQKLMSELPDTRTMDPNFSTWTNKVVCNKQFTGVKYNTNFKTVLWTLSFVEANSLNLCEVLAVFWQPNACMRYRIIKVTSTTTKINEKLNCSRDRQHSV